MTMTPPLARCPHCGGDLLADAWERGQVICLLCSRTYSAIDVVAAPCGFVPKVRP